MAVDEFSYLFSRGTVELDSDPVHHDYSGLALLGTNMPARQKIRYTALRVKVEVSLHLHLRTSQKHIRAGS